MEEKRGVLRGFYEWLLLCAQTKWALWVLGGVSFLNSSIFPVPQDVVLLPMMVARPKRSFYYGSVAWVCSCVGGVVGYGIGYFLYDSVGGEIMGWYGYAERVEEFKSFYDEYGWMMIVVAGITPFPYKVITIMSGFLGYSFLLFVVSSFAGRALRFYGYVVLFYFFGERLVVFIDRWFGYFAFGGFLLIGVAVWFLLGGIG